MKKAEIRELISGNIAGRRLFKYKRNNCDHYLRFSIVLDISKDLVLVLNEDDFILDGYSIIRLKDITEIELKGDLYEKILKKEVNLDNIKIPKISLDSWQTVFEDLLAIGNNIIIENEDINEDDAEFGIGRIQNVYKNSVHLKHFDADGIWQDYPLIIPYSKITTVTFGSRYVDVFSKYV